MNILAGNPNGIQQSCAAMDSLQSIIEAQYSSLEAGGSSGNTENTHSKGSAPKKRKRKRKTQQPTDGSQLSSPPMSLTGIKNQHNSYTCVYFLLYASLNQKERGLLWQCFPWRVKNPRSYDLLWYYVLLIDNTKWTESGSNQTKLICRGDVLVLHNNLF